MVFVKVGFLRVLRKKCFGIIQGKYLEYFSRFFLLIIS